MSDNLIATLRQAGHDYTDAAADEIEKLRAAIKMALDCIEDVDVIGARQTLTKALGEKE